MNTPYATCCGQLAKTPKKWLITGFASFTYAASSSTYGDHPGLPKVEDAIGKVQSLLGYERSLRLAESDAVVCGAGKLNPMKALPTEGYCLLSISMQLAVAGMCSE